MILLPRHNNNNTTMQAPTRLTCGINIPPAPPASNPPRSQTPGLVSFGLIGCDTPHTCTRRSGTDWRSDGPPSIALLIKKQKEKRAVPSGRVLPEFTYLKEPNSIRRIKIWWHGLSGKNYTIRKKRHHVLEVA